MKYKTMTWEEMLSFVKKMDSNMEKLKQDRERIIQEIREMQDRKEILSWDEIATAIAYPKMGNDTDRVSGGGPDEFKLLHQVERINKIYISQMEELFEELERVELEITKNKYINRCINRLDPEDRDLIMQFTCKDMTYEDGMELFHLGRTTLYRFQKKAIDCLLELYNSEQE